MVLHSQSFCSSNSLTPCLSTLYLKKGLSEGVMSEIIRARLWRIQLVFWFLVLVLAYTLFQPQLSPNIRTTAAIMICGLLIIINGIHFYKVDDIQELNGITPYLAPSTLISLLIQVVLIALLLERFFISSFRTQASSDVVNVVSAILYVIAGLVTGFINFIPAVYVVAPYRQAACLLE
jgi:hypothetical protein